MAEERKARTAQRYRAAKRDLETAAGMEGFQGLICYLVVVPGILGLLVYELFISEYVFEAGFFWWKRAIVWIPVWLAVLVGASWMWWRWARSLKARKAEAEVDLEDARADQELLDEIHEARRRGPKP